MRPFQLNRRGFLYAPDGGDGDPGGDKPGEKPDDTPPEPQTLEEFLKGKPEAERETWKKVYARETAALKSALDKEREARAEIDKEKKRIEKERAKAAEDKLAADKQFEELATQREKRIGELEPQVTTLQQERDDAKAKADEADKVISELVDAQTKALKLDEATLELLEGKTPVEKLRWFAKHAEKLGKGGGLLPVTPKGDSDGKVTDEEARKLTARTW